MDQQYATAEGVREEEFKDFLAPLTGRLYKLRRVWTVDLVRDGIFSIDQAGQLEAAQKKIAQGVELDSFDRALMQLFQNALICRGVANPGMRIVDRAASECAKGELSIDEFPRADYDAVFLAIADFSNLNGKGSVEQESSVSSEPREGEGFPAGGDARGALDDAGEKAAGGAAARRNRKALRSAAV